MKLALIGYGKMGHAVAEMAQSRGHEITLTINSKNPEELTAARLQDVDVAVEFSQPNLARQHVLQCIASDVPVVCGTTGWNEDLKSVYQSIQESGKGVLLYASNFSIGVNLFFELNRQLAVLMKDHPEYEPSINETHHTEKKDVPSGTALSLAAQILEQLPQKLRWALNDGNDKRALPVFAHRRENVPGTHSVRYHSAIDDIEIIHTAHNRQGFAKGAVLAAEFLKGRQSGVYTMQDVLSWS